jgi:curved DNA-binding protein CbpA
MAETFYGALDVAEDADDRTIERAYRERVKQAHPDVSDDPGATERFKRLTAARDVLLDDTERARYDQLGHVAYIREHLDSPVWADSNTADTGEPDRTRGADDADPGRRPGGDEKTPAGERIGWLGTDWEQADVSASGARAAGAGGSTEYGGQGWQRADTFYERTESTRVDHDSTGMSVATIARRAGPWLAIHAVLLLSALATVWFTYTEISRYVELSVPSLVFGIVLFELVVMVSVVHIISQVYR